MYQFIFNQIHKFIVLFLFLVTQFHGKSNVQGDHGVKAYFHGVAKFFLMYGHVKDWWREDFLLLSDHLLKVICKIE
jgi:hypothetical protein